LQLPPRIQKAAVPKPSGLYRIICLGGSTTEGKTNEYSYPQELEKMLQSKFSQKKIEVINGGHSFYSTQHSIIQYLFYLKDLEPDLIIFFHSFNDIMYSFTMPTMSSAPFKTDYGHFYGALRNLRYPILFEDFLSRFFFADIVRPAPQAVPFSDFKSLPIFKRNIETMIKITQIEDVDLILSNQAHRLSDKNDTSRDAMGLTHRFLIDETHYADEKSWYMAMELLNKTTDETAERFDVPMVDQATFFKGKRDLFTDCVHLTSEGTAKKAELFFEKIVDLELLE
jgi:lysophospholipase L1-like esterase